MSYTKLIQELKYNEKKLELKKNLYRDSYYQSFEVTGKFKIYKNAISNIKFKLNNQ